MSDTGWSKQAPGRELPMLRYVLTTHRLQVTNYIWSTTPFFPLCFCRPARPRGADFKAQAKPIHLLRCSRGNGHTLHRGHHHCHLGCCNFDESKTSNVSAKLAERIFKKQEKTDSRCTGWTLMTTCAETMILLQRITKSTCQWHDPGHQIVRHNK